jgi:outer membrane immunogenic protein
VRDQEDLASLKRIKGHAMLKLSVATITLVLSANVLASAADLPSLTAAPLTSPGPTYDWTGFYAGANVGFATDRYTFPYGFQGPGVEFIPRRGTIVSHGPIGGIQFGYNYEFPWKVVLGIDIEAEASGVGGNLRIGPFTPGIISTRVPLYGAFRARFGYAFDQFLLLDNVLVYLALGGAFGSFTDHMAVQVGPAFISYDQSTTRIRVSKAVGSLGIGAAHPITPNISVFVDYRYTALGPQWAHGRQIDVQLPDGVTAASFGTRAMYHLVRVGANWKFDLGI